MKLNVINSLIGLSGALLLSGCASSDYDDDAYSQTETVTTETTHADMAQGSVIDEASGAEPSQVSQGEDEWVIPLHEEQMNVGKRSVDSGEVTIRKVVTSEQVSQPVELRKETLTIEREPAGAVSESASGSPQAGGAPFQEDTITIRLQEEQPVVEKMTVQTGQVRARKDAQFEQREVQEQVRKEDFQVDRSGSGAPVTYRGFSDDSQMSSKEINEAAGAEQPAKSDDARDD